MTANLLSRLEGLTAPDREVDLEVHMSLAPDLYPEGSWSWDDKNLPPHLTASLDAAVALCERVLPGWFYRVGKTSLFPNGWAYISRTHPSHCDREDEASCADGKAATPAIALLIAILTALEARKNG